MADGRLHGPIHKETKMRRTGAAAITVAAALCIAVFRPATAVGVPVVNVRRMKGRKGNAVSAGRVAVARLD